MAIDSPVISSTPSIEGVPLQAVLDHLSERGTVEVQAALARARAAIVEAENVSLREQIAALLAAQPE